MIEEKMQEPLNTTDYVFTMDKINLFLEAVKNLPQDVGYYTVYNLTRLKAIVYTSPQGNVEEREQLFAICTEFGKGYEQLKALAEQESIFYAPSTQTKLFGEFLNFLPEQYSEELVGYLKSIKKAYD
jgi:hypothetical protein